MVSITVPARSRISPPRGERRGHRETSGGGNLCLLCTGHILGLMISLPCYQGGVKIRAGTPAISVRLAVYVFSSTLRNRWIAFGISLGETSLSNIPPQDACCPVFLVSTMQPASDQAASVRKHAGIARWRHLQRMLTHPEDANPSRGRQPVRMPCSAVLNCLSELRLTISRKCANVEAARLMQINTDSALPK